MDGPLAASKDTTVEATLFDIGRVKPHNEHHLRFVARNDRATKTSWLIGVIIDTGGAIIVTAPIFGQSKVEAIKACVGKVMDHLSTKLTDRVIKISVRESAFSLEKLGPIPAKLTVTLLEGSEISTVPPNCVDVILDCILDDFGPKTKERLTQWQQQMARNPQMVFRPITDKLCEVHEIIPTIDRDLDSAPSTVVVGLAGAGKSSLISALMGFGEEDLPPANISRTTLCPMVFRNLPELKEYHFQASFHPKVELLRRINDRLEASLEIALSVPKGTDECFLPRSPEVNALARSPDAMFDMRAMLGPYREGSEYWQPIQHDLREMLDLLRENQVSSNDLHDFGLVQPLAEKILSSLIERITKLSFGRVRFNDQGDMVFRYTSNSRKAAIEAGRRFFASGMSYSGQSFAPLCRRLEFSGPWVESGSFEIIDSRGFDHEGSANALAGGDLLTEIANADRVLVVENAEKVGDRQTMSLVSHIIATGEGAKILFAYSRVDIPLRKGADIDRHLQEGLINGLNTLDQAVGPNAVEVVRKTVAAVPPFRFANLDQAFHLGTGGLLSADYDVDLDIDNAHEANRLFSILCLSPDVAASEISAANVLLSYSGKKLEAALAAAWEDSYQNCEILYGPDEQTRGTLHWGTIKAEVRRVLRRLEPPEQDIALTDMTLLSEHAAVVAEHLSRLIDSPLSVSVSDDMTEPTPEDVAFIANRLRRHLVPVTAQAIIHRIILDHLPGWYEARNFSFLNYGPGSTLARAKKIREILHDTRAETPTKTFQTTLKNRMRASGVILKG